MLTILIDLDGTIIDPVSGIVASYRYALEKLGLALVDPERVRALIGPPLRHGLRQFLSADHDVEEAVRLYREHYGTAGMYDALLYSGMAEALAALRLLPARLFVCTNKAAHFAKPIVAHFGLAALFDGVYGPDLDGRFDDKADLVRHMVGAERIDPASAVMVGDRANDVRAASASGIATIGALWGYGEARELTEAGAAALCRSPAELPAALAALIGTRGISPARLFASP